MLKVQGVWEISQVAFVVGPAEQSISNFDVHRNDLRILSKSRIKTYQAGTWHSAKKLSGGMGAADPGTTL